MNRILRKYIILSCITFILTNCSAPRTNPLDPENPDNKIATIDGFIRTVKVPQNPIDDVKVFCVNEGLVTKSNKDGYFSFSNIDRQDGWIVVEKENYSTDSLFVKFESQQKISTDFFLNSIPKISDLKFYSVTVNTFRSPPNNQTYSLEIRANIVDDENDIDSVFIQLPELGTNKKLLYNASTKYYLNSISLDDLKLISIDAVIGKDFSINVFDSSEKEFLISYTNIKRIIKQGIETTSPSGRDTVFSKNPILKWKRFTPGFDYKYLLQIFTDETPANLVWEKEISSTEIENLTNSNLSSGDYFWVIWAIDEFENRTRSKPASFIIK